ncbi:MAG: Ig-like domain-containing protein [Candidatus Ornithomonoglobus sp.]
MKKKGLSLLTVLALAMGLVPSAAASGDGTPQNPYIITTAAELNDVRSNLGAAYKLGADIDMAGVSIAPIGNETEGAFTGALDGAGFVIKNLSMDLSYKSVGLIGYLEGTLTNLKLENVSIKGSRYTGALTGYAETGSSIISCAVSGTVDGGYSEAFTPYTGGIAGYSCAKEIRSCINSAKVTSAANNAGGIAGYSTGEITDCDNSGDVTAKARCAGGIIAENNGNITGCDNSGDVTASTDDAGSIAGYSSGCVQNCGNSGTIRASGYNTGGITGTSVNLITDCANTGYVSGKYRSGGISGYNTGTITNSNNSGTITASADHCGGISGSSSSGAITNCINSGTVSSSDNGVGGIIGDCSGGTITGCINDGNVSGSYEVGGISGSYGIIKNSVNTANVTSCRVYYDSIGGICGYYGSTYNCLNTGTITSAGDAYGIGGNRNHSYNCVNKGTLLCSNGGSTHQISGYAYYLYPRNSSISLAKGETAAVAMELYGYDRELTWTSSDDSVAAVDSCGNVTGTGAGTALVTVTTELGVSASVTVTVSGTDAAAEITALNKTSASLTAGETLQLSAELSPEGASANITWSSTNTNVATVDGTGLVTAVKTGAALIKARIGSGREFACAINVISDTERVNTLSVSIPQSSITLAPGDAAALNASVMPENATDKSLIYSSDNETAASVNAQGIVTARAPGSAVVRAQSANGCYDECVILVADASGPSVVMPEVKAFPGGTADMKFNIVANPGIAAYKLTVNYDKELLTPEEIIPNSGFGGSFETNLDDTDRDELYVLCYSNSDTDMNGELFTVRFRLSDDAVTGDTAAVSVSYGGKDVCNSAGRSIALYTTSSSVTAAETIPGDVYEDGDITVYDLTLLARYVTRLETLTERQLTAANVNDDEKVDIKDVVKLAQYLVGSSEVTLFEVSDVIENLRVKIESAAVDENGEAYIPVVLENNSGIAGFCFNIEYDKNEVEILDIIPNTDMLSENLNTNLGEETEEGLFVTWYNTDNITADGMLFTLKVRYSGDASSEIGIKADADNICDEQLENVLGIYDTGEVFAAPEGTDPPDESCGIESVTLNDGGISVALKGAIDGAKLITAAYAADGILLSAAITDVSEGDASVSMPLNAAEAAYVKVYLMESMETLKPLCACFTKEL